MSLIESLILGIPLLLCAGFSLLNGMSFFRIFRQKEEPILLHISLIFISSCSIFVFFLLAVFLPEIPPINFFLLANIFVWVIFLEVGNAYFSAFLNTTNTFERYSLPIFGGSIGMSVFTAINPDIYLLVDPVRIEVFLYLASFISVIYLLFMAYKRVNLILDNFEDEEIRLMILAQRVFRLGAITLVYTFVSVFCWLVLKGIEQLNLLTVSWNILDWLVYFNVILYLIFLLGAFIYSKKTDYGQIDLPSILNILDSPKTS
ncbi:hypothetical protein CEE45_07450 [Candidatus Heimdallarchaeota archaeon B3_Heim]|nr:MAG: hypothetical protein CEE45_07450 [Candidatus Heimdallarchaeota archaeon B3_Heim]